MTHNISTQQKLHIALTEKLFQWNTINLVSNANLEKSDISIFFAPHFQVIANGIQHEANYDNYYDFLNSFRAQIKTINYVLKNFIYDESNVVTPLTANIEREDNTNQIFDAILILKFNTEGKIILWHEVYVEV